MKSLKDRMEKAEVEKYMSNQEPSSSNLGELIQQKIGRQGADLFSKKDKEND